MSGNIYQLSPAQLNWLSQNYPTIAGHTEGGVDPNQMVYDSNGNPVFSMPYFSPPSSSAPNSTYSFGPFQFDVNNYSINNTPAAYNFLQNLTLNGQPAFTPTDLQQLSSNAPLSNGELTNLNNILSQALQQNNYNQSEYQSLLNGQLQNLETQLQNAINYAADNGNPGAANAILADPSAQLRIMDYANQLNITPGGSLEQFLTGVPVTMPATGNTLTYDPNQSIDTQLQNYYQNTLAGYQQTPGRVTNLNLGLEQVLGKNGPLSQPICTLALQLSYELGNAQKQVIDPLVISTNSQAVTTTSLANGAFVDYRGTGFEEQSSWLSANAGVLVDVTNPTGTLNNGFTIIGSSTTNQNGNKLGQSGFTQLAALDTNHDGVINVSDTDFNQIEIWVGSNGQPGSGHLETLAQAGITSISLSTTAVNTTDVNGDKTLATSAVTYGNGTTGTLSDMNMSVNTSNTIDESAGTINSAYATLPDVMTLSLNRNTTYQARQQLMAA